MLEFPPQNLPIACRGGGIARVFEASCSVLPCTVVPGGTDAGFPSLRTRARKE